MKRSTKTIRKFAMALLLVMAVFFGCSKKESTGNALTSGSETLSAADESTVAAEWNRVEEGWRNGLLGNCLLSATWNWDYETQSMRDVSVTMSHSPMEASSMGGKDAEKTVIFSADGLEELEIFTGSGNTVFYLYKADGQYMLRKDAVDAEGNVTTLYDAAVNTENFDAGETDALGVVREGEGVADGAGRFSLFLSDGRIVNFDEAGNYVFWADTNDLAEEEMLGDGLVVIGEDSYYYQVKKERLTLRRIDYESKTLAGKEYISYKGEYYTTYSGYQHGLYIVTDEGLCHYFADKSYDAKVVSWNSGETEIIPDNIRGLGIMGDGNVCLYYVDGQSSSTVELKTVLKKDYAERKRVVLGGISTRIDDGVKKQVQSFNRYSKDYYIEIMSYDFREEYSSFYMDLLKGEGADIFLLDEMPVENLAAKGCLEDLTSYFEASAVVNKEDIESAVWRAGEFAGGEYTVIPMFYTKGVLAVEGLAADGVVSLERIFSMLKEYPASIIGDRGDSAGVMNLFLYGGIFSKEIEQCLNMENGTCHFDDPKFIGLLEKAKEYAKQKRVVSGSATLGEQLYNKQIFLHDYFFYPAEYLDMKESVLDFTSITGYPNSGGEVCYQLLRNQTYGINSASRCKEGAWAFMEFLLSKEEQTELIGSFGRSMCYSARTDVNEAGFAQLIDGSHEIYHTNIIHHNRYIDQYMEEYGIFTEEDREVLRYIIDHSYRIDSVSFREVQDVVIEELNAYFAGDKTAEDTVKIIQQRLEIYFGEIYG